MIQSVLKGLENGSNSPAATATTQDALKSLRTAGIFALSAGVVAALQYLSSVDFGPYTAIAAPVIGFAIDFIRRWATDNTK